jgi:hypothetical protein
VPQILDLAEILEHGVYHLESLINFLTDFGAREDNLATDEDEQHNLGLNHAVDETAKTLVDGLIP